LSDKIIMKDNRCYICEDHHENNPHFSNDSIYDTSGGSMTIPLCYSHSIELFKTGQITFLAKHKNILIKNFGSENGSGLAEFLNKNH
jgi:hypothetical protein